MFRSRIKQIYGSRCIEDLQLFFVKLERHALTNLALF